MKKVLFIYSPSAGGRDIAVFLDHILERYQVCKYNLIPFRYTYNDDLKEALELINEDFHHILLAGGDGTVNRVITAMKESGVSIPIGILPTGTSNDFSRMLGMNSSIKIACEQILNGDIVKIDLGRANENYFVNILSAGLFTDVSQKTPTYLKNTFGKLAYYLNGVNDIPNFRTMNIRLKGDKIYYEDSILIIFVFNGKTIGNLPIAHESSVTDGLLDVILIKADNIAESIVTAIRFLAGKKNTYPKGILHFKTDKLAIELDTATTFDVDGEKGPTTPIEVECIKDAIEVIIPRGKQMLL